MAQGCQQLAQSDYAAALQPAVVLTTSLLQVRCPLCWCHCM